MNSLPVRSWCKGPIILSAIEVLGKVLQAHFDTLEFTEVAYIGFTAGLHWSVPFNGVL